MSRANTPGDLEAAANRVVSEWLNVSDDLREELAADNMEFVVAVVGLMEIVNPAAHEEYSKQLETPAK